MLFVAVYLFLCSSFVNRVKRQGGELEWGRSHTSCLPLPLQVQGLQSTLTLSTCREQPGLPGLGPHIARVVFDEMCEEWTVADKRFSQNTEWSHLVVRHHVCVDLVQTRRWVFRPRHVYEYLLVNIWAEWTWSEHCLKGSLCSVHSHYNNAVILLKCSLTSSKFTS